MTDLVILRNCLILLRRTRLRFPAQRPIHACSQWRLLCSTVLCALLVACKIQITVPPGGRVVTESGTYECRGRTTCEIDVVDQHFSETFIAKPNPGFEFMGWEQVPSAFCGNRIHPCKLSTAGFDRFPNLVAVLESDRIYHLRPVFRPVPTISRDDLGTEGSVVETEDGFNVSGSLSLAAMRGPERVFGSADLTLEFDEDGVLEQLYGEGLLPRNLSSRITVNADVMADIGYFSGAEINANDDIEIVLREKRKYLVFFISGDLSYTQQALVPGPGFEPEPRDVTVNTPASGKIVVILDPDDDMLYRYGETPLLGAFGHAESDQGLIPYVPIVEGNDRVYRFDGHLYKTISVGVGIKALDLLNLSGQQITYQPSFFDIDLSDPFKSDIAYKAGFNGAAEVAVSVLGFDAEGYFNFDLAEASASFDVNRNRQVMTLIANIEPDVSWVPDWIPIIPEHRLTFELSASGNGRVVLNLSGAYRSRLPPADIEGKMRITPSGLTMQGTVSDRVDIPIKLKFEDGDTYGEIGITADFSGRVESELAGAFDRAEDEVARALADLEEAVADYEFELSLRGLRASLPAIADRVISELEAVPGRVYSEVYARVRAGINDRNKCVLGVCVISNSTRDRKAREAASTARAQAESRIAPYIAGMKELKRSALEDDNAELVSKLEAALREAYSMRTFRETFRVTVTVAGISVTGSYTVSETILTASQAASVLEAANNIHLIPETSDRVVSAQTVIDRLPTQEIIDRVRRSVDEGITSVPAVEGVGYSIIDGEYSAAVLFSDGSRYDVEFNVLDWREVSSGIADLLAQYVIDRF